MRDLPARNYQRVRTKRHWKLREEKKKHRLYFQLNCELPWYIWHSSYLVRTKSWKPEATSAIAHTNRLNTVPASTDGLNSAPLRSEALCAMGGSHAHRGSLQWQRPPRGPCQRACAVHPFSQKSVHHTHSSLWREASGIKLASTFKWTKTTTTVFMTWCIYYINYSYFMRHP